MTYRAKLFIDRDLACFINKQLSISEEDAELESYYERSFEIPFLNGNVAEIRFCFDGSGWADGRLYDQNGDIIYQDEPSVRLLRNLDLDFCGWGPERGP